MVCQGWIDQGRQSLGLQQRFFKFTYSQVVWLPGDSFSRISQCPLCCKPCLKLQEHLTQRAQKNTQITRHLTFDGVAPRPVRYPGDRELKSTWKTPCNSR